MYKFKKSLIKTRRVSNDLDRSKNILNLDRNEKTQELSGKYKKIFNKYILNLNLNYYPNLTQTYDKLSRHLKLRKENILITEGVSGAIKNILDSITINNNVEIIVPKPSFALYEVYSKIYDIKVKTFSYDSYFNLNAEKIFKLVTKNTSIVFLPFPNIPGEGNLKLSLINKLAEFLNKKKVLLAVDEVYFPFNRITSMPLIKKYANLVVMRSFSKAYGLAGARIGYLLSNKNNIKVFSSTKGGYETNMLSAHAIHFALDNHQITKNYIKDVRNGLNYLKKQLKKMKIKFHGGTNSNFIFIDLNDRFFAKKIFNKLKKQKIIVRYGYKYPFDKGILLTGCPLIQMKKFFISFKKIYKWQKY